MSSTYNNTKELRFWCQKVLPLVYDDSLSYYELLNKIVVYLNSTVEDVQAMIADVTRIERGLSSKIDLTQKGVPNGVATLNTQGQVPLTQLPDISAGVQTISVNGVNVPADANKNVNIIVMTNAVSNLVNYYLKTETYNKTEVNALIDSVKNSRFEVVAQLPTTEIQTNVIYLVPKSVGQTQNGYDEFINLDGTTSGWELIGSTDIDLSGYVTDSELATALSAYVTTQSLNTTLASYVTSGVLTTTLEGYVTQMSFETLQSTVTSQGNTLAGLITTVNGKVDKVAGKGLSTNDYSNADKGIVDKIRDNVIANTKLIKDTVGWSGKQLIPFPYATWDMSPIDINITVNNDGSIKFNGTQNAETALPLHFRVLVASDNPFYLPIGRYKYDIGLTNILQIGTTYNGAYSQIVGRTNAKTVEFEITEDTPSDYKLADGSVLIAPYIIIEAKTYDNVTFTPIIYDADILDDTYEPYFGSTAFPRDEQIFLGAHNLCPKFSNKSVTGISWTVNTDETVSVTSDGTASEGDVDVVTLNATPFVGKQLKISGCIANGSSSSYSVDVIGKDSNNQNVFMTRDYGTGEITPIIANTVKILQIRIYISKTAVLTNAVFKPLLTLASDTNEVHTPYAMTNKELTDAIVPFGSVILSSADDMDAQRPMGIYPFTTAPTHSPENTTYGMLINIIGGNGNEQQYVMKGSTGTIYLRSLSSASPRTWSSWMKIIGTAVS